jgi:hypothetical protein
MTDEKLRTLRRKAIEKMLKGAKVSGDDELRRLKDYCDIAYRTGYRVARQRAVAQQRAAEARAARTPKKQEPIMQLTQSFTIETDTFTIETDTFTIETDTPIECPVCLSEILPGVPHVHGGQSQT